MKPRILVVALLAVLGSSCSTTADKQRLTLRIEPVQSIRHGAPNAQSYYQLGRYYQGQNRLDQAEEAYLKATALDDRYLDAFNALGSLYAQRGELERAAKMFEKLTAIVPDAAYLYNNLGFAYYLLGRQDEAYASVRKALTLDATLERGWANLERIAAKEGKTALVAAARAHTLDALPLAFGQSTNPDAPIAEPVRQVAGTASDPGFTLITEPSSYTIVEEVQRPDSANARAVQNGAESDPAHVGGLAAADMQSGKMREPVQDLDGRFVVVSAQQEFVPDGPLLAFQFPVQSAADQKAVDSHAAPLPVVRLEVSNGNGIPRFARNFSLWLRNDEISVKRITNYSSFQLQQTVIEYQPGFDAAAQALMQRTNVNARLMPAIKSRPGVDIRIVLGRDVSNFHKPELTKQNHKATSSSSGVS